jgi:hypothetical protein
MSTFISSTDKRPVYLNRLGEPLSYGKIYYYEQAGNPSVLKTVYTDPECTIPSDNPVLLTSSGRSSTQIFLGEGDYTAVSYQFNGVDVNTASPSDWSNDNQWDEHGLDTSILRPVTEIYTISTIADLKTLDNADYSTIRVLGYYEEDDCFPRIYRWSEGDVRPDNYGTIIRNPSVSSGCWVLNVEGPAVDCRIFGIIPQRFDTNNTLISSMVTAVKTYLDCPRAIFFPRGNYYVAAGSVSFDNHVIIDEGCRFINNQSGNYAITFSSTFDIRLTTAIETQAAGSVTIKFSSPKIKADINPAWFGVKYRTTTSPTADATGAIRYMFGQFDQANSYNVVFSGQVYYSYPSSSLAITTDVTFVDRGCINIQHGSSPIIFDRRHTVTNKRTVNHQGEATTAYRCFEGPSSLYRFTGVDVRASWYTDDTYPPLFPNSLFNSAVLTKCRFVFDRDVTIVESWTQPSGSTIVFSHESGLITISPGCKFKIDSLVCGSGHVFVADVLKQAYAVVTSHKMTPSNYFPLAATVAEKTTGLFSALYSAVDGHGELDLQGDTFVVDGTNAYSMDRYGGARVIKIHNGRIKSARPVNVPTFFFSFPTPDNLADAPTVELKDLIVEPQSSAFKNPGALLYINNDIRMVIVDNVYFYSTDTSSGIFIGHMGNIHQGVNIRNCDIRCQLLIGSFNNDYGKVLWTSYLTNNSRIAANITLMNTVVIASGNTFYPPLSSNTSAGGEFRYVALEETHIYNNTFWKMVLYPTAGESQVTTGLHVIAGTISDNIFNMDGVFFPYIYNSTRYLDSVVLRNNITNNRFNVSPSAPILPTIDCENSIFGVPTIPHTPNYLGNVTSSPQTKNRNTDAEIRLQIYQDMASPQVKYAVIPDYCELFAPWSIVDGGEPVTVKSFTCDDIANSITVGGFIGADPVIMRATVPGVFGTKRFIKIITGSTATIVPGTIVRMRIQLFTIINQLI